MSEKKNYCQTHHLYYKGNVCPMCEKERIGRMAEQYTRERREEKQEDREITEEDLARLVEKFNVR